MRNRKRRHAREEQLPRLRPPWEPPLSLADGNDGRALASSSVGSVGESAEREIRTERTQLVVW